MPSVPNREVESTLRDCLMAEGYDLSAPRPHGATGVDIKALRDDEVLYIECIGYKPTGPARAKDFFEGFFRTVSRLNEGPGTLVLSLASHAQVGLPARARQHEVAWRRFGDAFPELQLWLVDVEERAYVRHSWLEWLG